MFYGIGFWGISGAFSGSAMTWGALFYGVAIASFEVWDKDGKIVQTMPRERPKPEQVSR